MMNLQKKFQKRPQLKLNQPKLLLKYQPKKKNLLMNQVLKKRPPRSHNLKPNQPKKFQNN
jgi:hypothetical protein